MSLHNAFFNTMLLCLTLLPAVRSLASEPTAGKQVEQAFVARDGAEVKYLLYLPADFDTNQSARPLMLFLHGRGESNGPLSTVAKWGPPQILAGGQQLPYIVVSPQCPADDSWSSDIQQARLSELLDSIINSFAADADHIYLTGLSMGGSGSWRLAADNPHRFAAVVPICGRGNPEHATLLMDLPLWVFVGDQDRVYQANLDMVEAIRKAGSDRIRLTTLEHIGHNSWSAAYASPDLYNWLDQQSAKK
ncbi:MAG: dienelactone hydrolase family protein [Planctomycetales bacterium]|nr:dienelactone hydrolase family protein [Planctomycetales bacterium]